MQGWNVLIYGIDGKPPPDMIPGERPLLTGPNFGFDAVCMLHAHMRMRGNLQFWAGRLAYMADMIEYDITHIINISQCAVPVTDNYRLSHKIDILASVLRNAGVRESDVELFTHAAGLIRTVRNALVHLASNTQKSDVKFDIISDGQSDLYASAKRHKRDDLFLGWRTPGGGAASVLAAAMPYYMRLALLIDRWLLSCKTYYESLSTGDRSGADEAHASCQSEKTET